MARVLPVATSAGYFMTEQPYVIVGQILVGAGTTTIEVFRALAPCQTTSGTKAAEAPSEAGALSELRRLSGLSWGQLARALGVTRRTLHFWASGKAICAIERRASAASPRGRALDRSGFDDGEPLGTARLSRRSNERCRSLGCARLRACDLSDVASFHDGESVESAQHARGTHRRAARSCSSGRGPEPTGS
jgi:hypothetical protein